MYKDYYNGITLTLLHYKITVFISNKFSFSCLIFNLLLVLLLFWEEIQCNSEISSLEWDLHLIRRRNSIFFKQGKVTFKKEINDSLWFSQCRHVTKRKKEESNGYTNINMKDSRIYTLFQSYLYIFIYQSLIIESYWKIFVFAVWFSSLIIDTLLLSFSFRGVDRKEINISIHK